MRTVAAQPDTSADNCCEAPGLLGQVAHGNGSQGATVPTRHAELVQAVAGCQHRGGSYEGPRTAVPAVVDALAVLDLTNRPAGRTVGVRTV